MYKDNMSDLNIIKIIKLRFFNGHKNENNSLFRS